MPLNKNKEKGKIDNSINKICKICKNNCKQTSDVTLIKCLNFRGENNENSFHIKNSKK